MNRRVLMMTAGWPPVGRVGVRRPLRLARRLPALGWTPVVLTPTPECVYRAPATLDHSLREPPVEVHRVPGFIPSTRLDRLIGRLPDVVARPLQILLSDLLFPDQYPEWTRAAVAAAKAVAPVDAVWVTGGPWGIFVPGLAVARALGVPLVLDYRDPWTVDAPARRTPIAVPRPALRWLEGRILRQAAGVMFVNEDILQKTRAAFGHHGGPWRVIPNGFDPADVVDVAPICPLRPTLLYAGNCYGSRSMAPVLAGIADAFGPGNQGMQLRVFGELDPLARHALAHHALPGRVNVSDRIPADELAGHLRGADGLLLIIGEGHQTSLSAKVFDYLQAGRPILGYGPADCAAAEMVRRCGVGLWAHDHATLVDALRRLAERRLPYAPVASQIALHSADAMARRTVDLLDAVTGGPAAMPSVTPTANRTGT